MEQLTKFVNYMVPATGNTRGFIVSENFSSTPKAVNFFNVELDGVPFRPSGVFVDNSQGTDALIITINELAYRIVVPAGGAMQTQFPAPMSMSVAIVGGGQATCIFVDFPVIPFSPGSGGGGGGGGGGGAVTIANGASVALGSTLDAPVIDASEPATVIALLRGIAFLTESLAKAPIDTDGAQLPWGFADFPTTFTYTVDDQIETETREEPVPFGSSWTKTYTYTGTNLTAISGWVKNP